MSLLIMIMLMYLFRIKLNYNILCLYAFRHIVEGGSKSDLCADQTSAN